MTRKEGFPQSGQLGEERPAVDVQGGGEDGAGGGSGGHGVGRLDGRPKPTQARLGDCHGRHRWNNRQLVLNLERRGRRTNCLGRLAVQRSVIRRGDHHRSVRREPGAGGARRDVRERFLRCSGRPRLRDNFGLLRPLSGCWRPGPQGRLLGCCGQHAAQHRYSSGRSTRAIQGGENIYFLILSSVCVESVDIKRANMVTANALGEKEATYCFEVAAPIERAGRV
ncbi:unnamed protein product [Ectocarpus sp. 13 AM-2016]